MTERSRKILAYDIDAVVRDMAVKGWIANDLARVTGLSHTTISQFLRGLRQTPRVGKRVAKALGQPVTRYLMDVPRASEAMAS